MDPLFWWKMGADLVIMVLRASIKNEAVKKKIKSLALNIRDMINVLFPEESFTNARKARAIRELKKAA